MGNAASGHVLLVDDDPAVLESSSLILNEYGYEVIPSSGADEALSLVRGETIDVVVTDVVMPARSGIDLLRDLHALRPELPVILMTAYADLEKVIYAIKMGAFDFIVKPFTADLLIHSVEKAVNYNRLVQTEKDYKQLLEEYNRDIESLISERTMSLMALTLADRIRNPVSVIGMLCSRMARRDNLPDGLRSDIDDLITEARKLDETVRDFQSVFISRKATFQYEDINNIVRGIIPVVQEMASRKGQFIEYRPLDREIRVNSQKQLLQMALSHLLKNAVEASPVGGLITVGIGVDEDRVILSIKDSGPGISKENLGKIFDPIFSTKEKRFGMGLPLVKRIVREHMGINVRSEMGRGTTFEIVLPQRWTRGVEHMPAY
jgi:signal transduction histidine kinase